MSSARSRYIRQVWLIGIAASLACTVALDIWAAPRQTWSAPIPAFVNPLRDYVSSYRTGYADHYLFEYGILGFRQRMRDSDVLLLGSSHIELGADAQQLSTALAEALGRPIKAMNLGRDADGHAFTRRIIELNDIRDKIVIIDLFEPQDGFSPIADQVHAAGLAGAYSGIFSLWFDYAGDWLKDHVLPRLLFEDRELRVTRQLTSHVFRSWATADPQDFWHPVFGDRYHRQQTPPAIPAEHNPIPAELTWRLLPDAEYCRRRNLKCFYTLTPFFNADGVTLDNVGSVAEMIHIRYLPIDPSGMTYIDNMRHLDDAGRRKATARLADQLIAELKSESR